MKLKEGFLALTVAAALATPAAFAQQEQAQEKIEANKPGDQIDEKVGEGPTPGHTSLDPVVKEDETPALPQASADSDAQEARRGVDRDLDIEREQRDTAGLRDDTTPMTSQDRAAVGAGQAGGQQEQFRDREQQDRMSMQQDRQARDQQQAQQGQQDQGRRVAWGPQGDVPPPVDGETIRNVQQALKDQGQNIKVDGIWGRSTHQALRDFQRSQNIDGNGQLNAETFAALNLMDRQRSAGAESSAAAGGGAGGGAGGTDTGVATGTTAGGDTSTAGGTLDDDAGSDTTAGTAPTTGGDAGSGTAGGTGGGTDDETIGSPSPGGTVTESPTGGGLGGPSGGGASGSN
jgi:hypothetical protein